MQTIDIIQITLELWCTIFLIFCAVITLSEKYSTRRRWALIRILTTNILLLISDSTAIYLRGRIAPFSMLLNHIGNYIVFCCTPILALWVLYYLRLLVEENGHSFRKISLHIMYVLASIYLLLITSSQFTHVLYYYDENNHYQRGPLYMLSIVFAALFLLIIAICVFVYWNCLHNYEILTLFSYILLPMASMVIQFFYYGLSLNNIAITLSSLAIVYLHERQNTIYIIEQQLIVEKQKNELQQKNTELALNQLQMSISQIKPHFIFNALSSIEYLCSSDSEKATLAIRNFSNYLRNNLISVEDSPMVPFHKELNHIRAYTWLEQMRFGKDLLFEEYLEDTDFMVPALSIQPLVENAIKYGIMSREDGRIDVYLITREEEDSHVIIIEDNGEGFDPSEIKNDGRNHIGLKNVEKRIKMLTQGSMEIDSKIGEGTTITIRIPKCVNRDIPQ